MEYDVKDNTLPQIEVEWHVKFIDIRKGDRESDRRTLVSKVCDTTSKRLPSGDSRTRALVNRGTTGRASMILSPVNKSGSATL